MSTAGTKHRSTFVAVDPSTIVDRWQPEPLLLRNRCLKMVTEPEDATFWPTNRLLSTQPPWLTPGNQNHSSGATGVSKWPLTPKTQPFGPPTGHCRPIRHLSTAGKQNHSSGVAGVSKWSLEPKPPPFGSPTFHCRPINHCRPLATRTTPPSKPVSQNGH